MSIPTRIIQTLGGRRYLALAGVRQLLAGRYSVSFSVPNRTGADRVRIRLLSDDLYSVETYLDRGESMRLLRDIDRLSLHELSGVVESVTGLRTQ